jgi:hypothetical protein
VSLEEAEWEMRTGTNRFGEETMLEPIVSVMVCAVL